MWLSLPLLDSPGSMQAAGALPPPVPLEQGVRRCLEPFCLLRIPCASQSCLEGLERALHKTLGRRARGASLKPSDTSLGKSAHASCAEPGLAALRARLWGAAGPSPGQAAVGGSWAGWGGPGQAGGLFRAGGSGGGVPGGEGGAAWGRRGWAARRAGPLASVPGAEGPAPSARRGSRSAAVAKCIFKAM